MKPETLAVFDLFDKQRRYLIPIFQRGYVWDEERQWAPLWNDILNEAEAIASHGQTSSRLVRKHFLGAVVLVQAPTVMRQIAAYEVIDGQQRLMTLQIVLTAMRDIAVEVGNDYVASSLKRLTANPGPLSFGEEVFKVWPTNAYREDFQSALGAGSATALSAEYPQRWYYRKWVPARPKLVEAYLYFSKVIRAYLEGVAEDEEPTVEGTPEERLEGLYETIARHIQLVTITLDDEDDPQVIFETLNARGEPLEPSDLVRNFFFLYAARKGEDVSRLYDLWWSRFDTGPAGDARFWKDKERQGRLLRSRLDLFLFHYVTCRAAHEISIGHLYQEFRGWWYESGTDRNTEVELEALTRFSEYFRRLWDPDANSRLGLLATRLRVIDTTTAHPLLLWIQEHEKEVSEEEYQGVLSDIESYLVRRAVCGLTPKNYNRVFLGLLTKLVDHGVLSGAVLRDELLALKGNTVVWPDDQVFEDAIMHAPLYLVLRPRMVQMVLAALEVTLRGPKTEPVGLPSTLSVEHILPQGASVDVWPYPTSSATLDSEDDERIEHRQAMTHTLGNLTLLTQQLNSSVSNGPYGKKKVAILGHSVLRLNSYLQNLDHWDEDTIRVRGKEVARLAVLTWPR